MSTPEQPRRPPAPQEPATQSMPPRAAPQERLPAVERAPVYERLPPEVPPREPWWDNSWAVLLAGIVALLIGGGVGYLVGQESESGRRAAVTHTITNTATVPKTVVQTHTVTASTVKETPSPANQANEARLREAEVNLRKAEKENKELSRQVEEAGRTP